MRLNPEFQRNLWIEFSPTRLIAAPLILAAVLLLGHQIDGVPGIAQTAEILFFLIAVLWGTRRAAAALSDEVTAATWDGQRMSALSAWQMAWGKLFGSTAFIWYCGLICLGAGFLAETLTLDYGDALNDFLSRVLSGLLAQCVALAACLVFLRKLRPTRRVPVSLSQGLGIVIGISGEGLWHGLNETVGGVRLEEILWYGRSYDSHDFALVFQGIFLAWAFLCIYRLIRAELQVPSGPWAWAAFTIFMAGFVQGFSVPSGLSGGYLWTTSLGAAFVAAYALLYAALFCEQKSSVAYRALLQAIQARDWQAGLRRSPLWVVTGVLLLPLATVLMVQLNHAVPLYGYQVSLAPEVEDTGALWVVACLLFVLRDVGVLLFLNFGRRRRRADLAGLIYLVALYLLVPPILFAADLAAVVPVLIPLPGPATFLAVGAASFQALAVGAAVGWRLQRATGEPKRAPE